MPRNNKVTGRVFAEIAKTNKKKGAFDEFLAIDETMGFQESDILKRLKEDYKSLVTEMESDINVLAKMEEIITQIRAKEAIWTELRLSLSRNYIYARSSFYRTGKKINDIRVIIGKVDEYGDNINDLLLDTNFRLLCQEKLIEAMDKEINDNIADLNSTVNELKIGTR